MAWPIGRLWRACVAGVALVFGVYGVCMALAYGVLWRCVWRAMALCRRVYGVGVRWVCTYG